MRGVVRAITFSSLSMVEALVFGRIIARFVSPTNIEKEISRPENPNPPERVQCQQIGIPRNDHVRRPVHSKFENLVVLRVSTSPHHM